MTNLLYKIYRWYTMDGEGWRVPVWTTPFKDNITDWMQSPDFYQYEIEVLHRHPKTHQEIELESFTGTEWVCRESEVS